MPAWPFVFLSDRKVRALVNDRCCRSEADIEDRLRPLLCGRESSVDMIDEGFDVAFRLTPPQTSRHCISRRPHDPAHFVTEPVAHEADGPAHDCPSGCGSLARRANLRFTAN
jgi:hypothetical protein